MLKKAVDILQMVSVGPGCTTKDIGAALGYSRSASHRLVNSLLEVGLIERRPGDDGFMLGRVLEEIVSGPVAVDRLRQLAVSHLDGLRDTCGETVGLHCIRGDRRILLAQAECRQEHRWVYGNLLMPMPLHAGAASKMLLALLSRERVERIVGKGKLVSFTKSTQMNSQKLIDEIDRIRSRGYALSFEEVTPGIASIAAPVTGIDEPAVVSITGPSVRLSEAVLKRLLPLLRATGAAIGVALAPRAALPRAVGQ